MSHETRKLKIRQLAKSDKELLLFKSPIAEGPLIVAVTAVSILCLDWYYRFPNATQTIIIPLSTDSTLPVTISLFGIIPLILLAVVAHRLWNFRYVIGQDYVRTIEGLLSISKKDMRLEFHNIRGVEIDRSLYGRIVNIGDLLVGSSMHAEIELQLRGLRDPSFYRDVILHRMRRAEEEFYRKPDGSRSTASTNRSK